MQCSDLEVMLEDMQQQLKDAKAKHEMLSTLVARVISLQHHGVNEHGEPQDDVHHADNSEDEEEAEEEEESADDKSAAASYVAHGDEETGSGSSSGVSVPQGDGDIRSADVSKPF